MLDFVDEAWAAVPGDTLVRPFGVYAIRNTLDGSEEGDLHCGLARHQESGADFKRNSANFSLALT